MRNFRSAYLQRSQWLIWIMIVTITFGVFPSVAIAQQPTATIESFRGTVLVNGVQQVQGRVLRAGDVVDTGRGSNVALRLSDNSLLEIQENTRTDLSVLAQTSTGARVSRVRLLWGRVRAALSPGHQRPGSNFNVETPNALIGVKFSVPIVEVTYDPAIPRTIAFGDGIDLLVTDLVSGITRPVPANSTAVVDGMGIRVFPGRIDPGNIDAPPRSGIHPAVWGAGIVAAAGGVFLLTEDSKSSNSESDSPSTPDNTPDNTGECSGIAGTWRGSYSEIDCIDISDISPRRSGSWFGTINSNCSMQAFSDQEIWFTGTISDNILNATGTDSDCGAIDVNGMIEGSTITGSYFYEKGGEGQFSGEKE